MTNTLNYFILRLIILYKCFISISSNGIGTFKTIHTGPKPIWNETHLDKLKKDLLLNYDRFLRPEHHNNVTNINISLTILHLETEETKSLITVDCWIALKWSDSKLKWNESDYGGLSMVKIGDHEVWQPDIYLYNSLSGGEQLSHVGSKNVLVYSKGEVLWVPSIKLTALCDYNLRYWPFDKQYCFLKLGSWTMSSEELKVRNRTDVTMHDTVSASSWIIEANGEVVGKKYPCCNETYEAIIYHLNITRKSTPYCAIVVTPAVVSTFLILTQFWLPPYAEEKLILNGFVVTLLNMFLLYFNHQIYTAASQTPLIVLFYSSSLYIVGFSSVSSVITYLMCKVKKRNPLPEVIKKLMQGRWGKWLLLDQHTKLKSLYVPKKGTKERKDNVDSEFDNEYISREHHVVTNLIQQEWIILAVCIDRLCFVIYTFVFIILAIAFS